TYKCPTSSQQSPITKPHHNPPNHAHKLPVRMYRNPPNLSTPKILTSRGDVQLHKPPGLAAYFTKPCCLAAS
ncbi:hypothetical protein GIB67_007472, partial [Kingdonia uniflora]